MTTEKEIRKSQHRLLVIVCILVFCLFLGYTIIWEIDYFSKYGNFKRVKCTVVEYYEEDGKKYDVFTFETDKKEFVKKVSTFESKYDIGDTFHVYYDENTEIEIIYHRDIRVIMLPTVTTIFGAATVGVIVIYILSYKKNKVRK